MKHWLICYDIEDDRERRRLHKCLNRYGTPVQKSVFEVSFPDRKTAEEERMVSEIRVIIGDNANVRFYSLTRAGIENSWTLDDMPIMERTDTVIL